MSKRKMTFDRLKHIYKAYIKYLIDKSRKTKDWGKIKLAIEKYLSTLNIEDNGINLIGVNENLLLNYARSLIAVGQKRDALKIMKLIEKMFIKMKSLHFEPKSDDAEWALADELMKIMNSPVRSKAEIEIYKYLIILYAMCSRIKDVKRILKILEERNAVDNELYLNIAYNIWLAGRLDYAKDLYEQVLGTTKKDNEKQLSEKAIERINAQQQYPEEFRECWYSTFLHPAGESDQNVIKRELKPGHVIIARNIYKTDGKTPQNEIPENVPLMIWKKEGNKLIVFQLTTSAKKEEYSHNYIISGENYPLRGKDRALKDRLHIVYLDDVEKVVDRIKPDDFQRAIDTVYTKICYGLGGKITEEYEKFIGEMTKKRKVFVGNIIITSTYHHHQKNYFIVGVDREKGIYRAIEVDLKANALSQDIVELDINETKIRAILSCGNQYKKKQLLEHAGILRRDGNKKGIVFELNGRKLEIMKETPRTYVCMDITEGLWPSVIKIIAVSKEVELDILDRISIPKTTENQTGNFNDKLGGVKAELRNRKLTKKLCLKR